jgi:hypothetical protein
MPRKSAEDRSMNVFRLPGAPPEPPADLTPEGKSLWRETVRERPADWFNPVSTRLLHILVRQLVVCSELQTLYDMQPSFVQGVGIMKQLLAVSANCASIAARLRLVPQAQIDRRSGRITEKGTSEPDDGLLGGQAAWGAALAAKADDDA